jgi:hypothetical protein
LRSRKTNILQLVVLISGIIYILIGLFNYFSPLFVLNLFAENVSENWFDLVRDHELIAPLYFMVKAFSALLFTSGILMIMPLFDPLKYRGVIYFNGVLFPLMASIVLIKNGLLTKAKKLDVGDAIEGDYSHTVLIVLGVVLLIIFISCLISLAITGKDAAKGRE